MSRQEKPEQTAGFPAFAEAAVTSALVAKAPSEWNLSFMANGLRAGRQSFRMRIFEVKGHCPCYEKSTFHMFEISEPHCLKVAL